MTTSTRAPALQLYEAKEVAEMLAINERTLYELARKRRIPYRKIGSRGVRFTQADIEKIIETGYRPPVEQ